MELEIWKNVNIDLMTWKLVHFSSVISFFIELCFKVSHELFKRKGHKFQKLAKQVYWLEYSRKIVGLYQKGMWKINWKYWSALGD